MTVHRIVVSEEPREHANSRTYVIGHDVRMDYRPLEHFYFHALDILHVDLLYVAGVVMLADRQVARSESGPWARHFKITMPVHDPATWRSSAVTDSLEESLRFLTGDTWEFEFTQRKRQEDGQRFLKIARPTEGELVVFPYSGGLDSFAALRIAEAAGNVVPILVTTRHGSGCAPGKKRKGGTRPMSAGIPFSSAPRVGMPVRFRGKHREFSCRSRAFLFLSVASVTAYAAGAQNVWLPENGQGSIAVNVIPCGREPPVRGMHPGFSRRFSRLLEHLMHSAPRFHHPNLWITKGEMLRHLRDRGILNGWAQTRSCALKLYRQMGAGVKEQCGVCCNCLLRRMSLYSAGVDAVGVEPYVWSNLSAPTFAQSTNSTYSSRSTDNNLSIAVSGVFLHNDVADAAEYPDNHVMIQRTAFAAAEGLGIPVAEALRQLRTLLSNHRREWRAFLSVLSSQGWVAKLAGGT